MAELGNTISKRILTRDELMKPRIVSLADLRARLLPLCLGYTWAENAIVDLWTTGAPVPQYTADGEPDISAPERRVLIPEQFANWWGEVQRRMGLPDGPADVYPLPDMQAKMHNVSRR